MMQAELCILSDEVMDNVKRIMTEYMHIPPLQRDFFGLHMIDYAYNEKKLHLDAATMFYVMCSTAMDKLIAEIHPIDGEPLPKCTSLWWELVEAYHDAGAYMQAFVHRYYLEHKE